MTGKRLKILFIGSSGRSGSTLLERMLGQDGCFFGVGEIHEIWTRGFQGNHLCECGQPFRSCSFWQAVVSHSFGTLPKRTVTEIKASRRAVCRWRHIPFLIQPYLRTQQYEDRLKEYSGVMTRLYRGITAVSKCEVIVDSSKCPAYGLFLSTLPDVELHMVFLVRDSRAVAYSWQRRKVRAEITTAREYMPFYGSARAAWDWSIRNALLALLASRTQTTTLVRYEDLVSSPQKTLNQIIAKLGGKEHACSWTSTHEIMIKKGHGIGGNPVRFRSGLTRIRMDAEWRNRLAPRDRLLVTALTWPMLIRYHYGVGGAVRPLRRIAKTRMP